MVGVLLGTLVVLWLAHRILERRARVAEGYRYRRQMALGGLGLLGLLGIILASPVSGELRGQLLSFVAILLSAAVGLSSTTLLGNGLAALMLRTIRSFRMGDFIRVGEHFGRVSERGLFHTEIQTQDRELTTLPNLYLVTHPVTTIRSSGTIVAATVSLGYEVPRTRVEELLLDAAREAELEEPFVQVTELGNYSVTYRVAALLKDVSRWISAHSRLRAATIDALHRGGVEIVSPMFMNQRVFPEAKRFIPQAPAEESPSERPGGPEAVVFDKAEEAEALEQLKLLHGKREQELERLHQRQKEAEDPQEKEKARAEITRMKAAQERLGRIIERRERRAEGAEASPPKKA